MKNFGYANKKMLPGEHFFILSSLCILGVMRFLTICDVKDLVKIKDRKQFTTRGGGEVCDLDVKDLVKIKDRKQFTTAIESVTPSTLMSKT